MNATTAEKALVAELSDDESISVGGRITSRRLDAEVIARLQKSFDGMIVFVLGMVTYIEIAGAWDRFEMMRGVALVTLAAFLFLTVARESGSYRIPRLKSPVKQISCAMLATFAAAAAAFAAALLTGMALPWVSAWVAAWLALAVIVLAVERTVISIALQRLSRAGRLAHRVALVGDAENVAAAIERLTANGPEEVDICGYFDDRGNDRSGQDVAGYPKLGDIDDLVEFSRWFRIDSIVVTLPLAAENRLLHLLKRLWEIPADIRISALGSKLMLNRRTYSKIGDLPLLDTFDRPISSWNGLVKSFFDRSVALAAIVAFSPLMLATALAVRLESRGPALFKQRRYGFNNELIEIYKFRSMKVEASDADAARLVTRDDDRVTRVGRFIRKSSLDELPQLFNVLKGDLSLVGPRPHALKAKAADELYDTVVAGYLARHRVKPGVTGWAQINGWRGETDTHEKIERRVECDLYYIDHWSIWLDLYILAATPLALFNTKQAF